MKTSQKRAWACVCGNPIINVKLDYEEFINVDAQFEIGLVVCAKCRKVPTLVEQVVDRQPKSPSRIIVPGNTH